MILIPPEFSVPGAATFDSSQIVSTLTNSYDHVYVAKLSPYDRYAPNWTLVAITVDLTVDFSSSKGIYYNHQNLEFTRAGEWYYARINGVTAPSVAGRYFFKMALSSMLFIRYPASPSPLFTRRHIRELFRRRPNPSRARTLYLRLSMGSFGFRRRTGRDAG